MKNPILIAEGTFSRLIIELNDSVIQKLALIPKKDNPLASVEHDMKKVLNDFEIAYFNFTHKKADDAVTDLQLKDPEADTTVSSNAPKTTSNNNLPKQSLKEEYTLKAGSSQVGNLGVALASSKRLFKQRRDDLLASRQWLPEHFEEFIEGESEILRRIVNQLRYEGLSGVERGKHNHAMQQLRVRRTRDYLWLLNPYCGLCGKGFASKSEVTIDHIIPKHHGGKNEAGNKQLTHMRCNTSKGHQLIYQDWGNDLAASGFKPSKNVANPPKESLTDSTNYKEE